MCKETAREQEACSWQDQISDHGNDSRRKIKEKYEKLKLALKKKENLCAVVCEVGGIQGN